MCVAVVVLMCVSEIIDEVQPPPENQLGTCPELALLRLSLDNQSICFLLSSRVCFPLSLPAPTDSTVSSLETPDSSPLYFNSHTLLYSNI